MIKRNLNLDRAIDVALYGRMSTDDQNERSPEQQFDAIRHEIARQHKAWTIVAEYRDDGLSGRLIRKRPGLMQLLEDIKTGKLKVRAILVHTLERFGRADEMAQIRAMLLKRFGIVILTCDSGFVDPTSQAGQALGFFEHIRTTSAAPVKAVDVFRGKRDAALLKHWPGGPPPFGYRLKYTMTEKDGKPEVDFATLEENPQEGWVIRLLFECAASKGWGTTRLARWLNEHPEIDNRFKPFYASTVGYWLDQPIYYGELLWAEHSTDVIDDVRVLQRNDVDDQVRVQDFCTPLVSRELWDIVQGIRDLRRRAKRPVDVNDPYHPPGAGRVLKLILSGLVRCKECGASMQPCTSGSPSKGKYHYSYYCCPRRRSGACPNHTSVREDYLRKAVVATLRQKLFPIDPQQPLPEWLPPLFAQVRAELSKLSDQAPDRREALRAQIQQIEGQLSGWLQSLGKVDLPVQLRGDLERQYTAGEERRGALERELLQLDHVKQATEALLDPKDVLDRLKRLDTVLAGSNPTLTNVELSRHIARIDVHADGRVVLHACRLGVLDGAVRLLSAPANGTSIAKPTTASGSAEVTPGEAPAFARVVSRSRTKLRVDIDELENGAEDLADCCDVHRFQGLDPSWFWEETLELPRTVFWSDGHADQVAALWATDPTAWTLPRLAERFGVSTPTARKALRAGQAAAGMAITPRKLAPRGIEDARQIADEAARLYLQTQPRLTIRRIASQLKVNQVTVSKALDHWYAERGLERPDGRASRTIRVLPSSTSNVGAENSDPSACGLGQNAA
jgi:DNA invertase Pin-like site-specific DNA recombinase